eukprot:m.107797 g.107797  ORF g.107797 m.107797 type:complete len:242 (-) comp27821_c1_seq1:27-752(-)
MACRGFLDNVATLEYDEVEAFCNANPQQARDCRDTDGSSAITIAAKAGAVKMIQILVSSACQVSAGDLSTLKQTSTWIESSDRNTRTALHHAVLRSHASTVALLIELGANVDSADISGHYALHVCSSLEIARMLIKRGADVLSVNNANRTPRQHMELVGVPNTALKKMLGDRENHINTGGNSSVDNPFLALSWRLLSLIMVFSALVSYYAMVWLTTDEPMLMTNAFNQRVEFGRREDVVDL